MPCKTEQMVLPTVLLVDLLVVLVKGRTLQNYSILSPSLSYQKQVNTSTTQNTYFTSDGQRKGLTVNFGQDSTRKVMYQDHVKDPYLPCLTVRPLPYYIQQRPHS